MRIYLGFLFLILLTLALISPSPAFVRHARYYHVAAATEGDSVVWQFTGPAYQICVQTTRAKWVCH